MNAILTLNGKFLRSHYGEILQAPASGAPNRVALGQSVTLHYETDSAGVSFMTLSLPSDLDPSITGMRFVWRGRDTDGAKLSAQWNVPSDLLPLPAGLHVFAADFGKLAFGEIGDYRLVLTNASGDGLAVSTPLVHDRGTSFDPVSATVGIVERRDALACSAVIGVSATAGITERRDALICQAAIDPGAGVTAVVGIIERRDVLAATARVAVAGTVSLTERRDTLVCTAGPVIPAVPVVASFLPTYERYPGYWTCRFHLANATTVAPDTIDWTTSITTPEGEISEAQVERGGVYLADAANKIYEIRMADPAKRGNPATQNPRTDFSVFAGSVAAGFTEANRVLRFRLGYTKAGLHSAFTAQLTIPLPTSPTEPGITDDVIPFVMRFPEEKALGKIGGEAFQFYRSFGTSVADPEAMAMCMDQNGPMYSENFGGRVQFRPDEGLYAARSGTGCWMDPGDADRILMSYVGTGNSAPLDPWEGVSLSTDGGKSYTLVHALQGTGTTSNRANRQPFSHEPGGTPSTRIIWAALDVTDAGPRILKSTTGGASWSVIANLSGTTYGTFKTSINGLAVAGAITGGYRKFMWGDLGAWYSNAAGTSWTKITNGPLPNQQVFVITYDRVNDILYAAVKNSGFYKSTDNGDTWELILSGDARWIEFSEPNPQRLCACFSGGTAKWSHDGGETWGNITTNEQPGELYGSGISGEVARFVAHKSDPDIWFAHRRNGFARSIDGGKTFNWAGEFFLGGDMRGYAEQEGDPSVMVFTWQDRVITKTFDHGLSVYDAEFGINSNYDGRTYGEVIFPLINPGKSPSDPSYFNAHFAGGAPLVTSTGRVITAVGGHTVNKIPVVLEWTSEGFCSKDDIRLVEDAGISWGRHSAWDPNTANAGFLGHWYVTNAGAATKGGVTFARRNKYCIGCRNEGGTTVSYWVNTSDSGTASREIYRSTNNGASFGTPWVTMPASMRPVDNHPELWVSIHESNTVYVSQPNGRLAKVSGASSPTITTIFDAADHVPSAPLKRIGDGFAEDPGNDQVLYVGLWGWGIPNVFKSADGGDTWVRSDGRDNPTVNANFGGAPAVEARFACHSSGDVIFRSSHGSHVIRAHGGNRANSLHAALRTYLKAHL